jgi:hypothetical protein
MDGGEIAAYSEETFNAASADSCDAMVFLFILVMRRIA